MPAGAVPSKLEVAPAVVLAAGLPSLGAEELSFLAAAALPLMGVAEVAEVEVAAEPEGPLLPVVAGL